ncbi:unnamed protein product [Ectocarpus sp. CCAP 1310/34]|nr:unnamed protein product [Ectocarpus sp. CCAP 1310/34]
MDSSLERGTKEAENGDGRTGGGNSNSSSSSSVAATAAASSAPTAPKNAGAGDTDGGSVSAAGGGSGTDGGRGVSAGVGGLQAQGVVGWKTGAAAQALPAGTDEWTLEQLAESFEGDRLERLLRAGDGGGEGQSAGGGGLRSKSGRSGAAAGVSLMKERVLQLRNAIAREKLKPLGNRLVQAS